LELDDRGKPCVSNFTCPQCRHKQQFLADQEPDDCVCGYSYHDEQEAKRISEELAEESAA